MSDYLPPGSEMHINQMPEECLRTLFSQLPVETQFKAGDVCRLWRTVQDALFRTQKSLTIKIGSYRYNRDNMNCLIIAGLKKERTAFLVAMFPSLTELTIFVSNQILFNEPSQVAHLLDQYRNQLVTLKINSEGDLYSISINFKRPVTCPVLFSAINSMSKLKQLSLDFDKSSGALLDLGCSFPKGSTVLYLEPFDLPILRQLDKLDLKCYIDGVSNVLKLWAPHLEARSTPVEISFTGSLFIASFDSITPKVGSMFTQFPKLRCNLQQFQHLSTCFPNLTHLSLSDYATFNQYYTSDVPALMRTLVNLKQLTTLSIEAIYIDPLNDQPNNDDHLLQLPTVKKWHLELRPPWTHYSHDHLSPWTANLSRFFPALEDLSITIDSPASCADCGFINDPNVPAKDCLRRQLGLIKQQCPNLNKARIRYSRSLVSRTLDDLAD